MSSKFEFKASPTNFVSRGLFSKQCTYGEGITRRMEKISGEREKRTVLLIRPFLRLPFATLHLLFQSMQHRTGDLLRYKFDRRRCWTKHYFPRARIFYCKCSLASAIKGICDGKQVFLPFERAIIVKPPL